MIVESFEDVINLSGSLKYNFWDTVHTAISLTLKRHATGVIIDCSGITDCTHEGAETFRDILAYIQEHDARVICVAVPSGVMEVLKTTAEVRSQLPIASSVEEARHSLDLLAHTRDGKKKQPFQVEELTKIVLYLTGGDRDTIGLEAAKRMAGGLHGEVLLVYVIAVPRELPLQAPLTKEEDQALAALQAAQQNLTARGVPHQILVHRGRDVASSLEDVMDEQKGDVLLIPLSSEGSETEADLKLIKSALAKVSSQVGFIRAPMKK